MTVLGERAGVRHLAIALLLAATCVTMAADPPVKGRFDALLEVTSSEGTRSMNVTIEVLRPMSVEESKRLHDVLESGGQQAVINAVRGSSRGRLLLGAVGFPLDIVVAERADDGWRYVVVTSRNLEWNEVRLEESSADYPFAVAEFIVPDMGTGEGSLVPRASLSIDEEGDVAVEGYEGESGRMKNIRRR